MDGYICNGAHRYFVALDGTIEGADSVKVWVLVVCTVCRDSHLIERVMNKTVNLTEPSQP